MINHIFNWVDGTTCTKTANEMFADIQQWVYEEVRFTGDPKLAMELVISPYEAACLMSTNQFNVSVLDLCAKHFPNMKLTVKADPSLYKRPNFYGCKNCGGPVLRTELACSYCKTEY